MKSSLRYEIDNYSSGTLIAGFDEVGRGAIAGPIVVASVILKPNFNHPLIKDSKQLSAKQRIAMYQIIIDNALTVVVSIKSHQFVNIHNPKQTSILAMIEAFNKLKIVPDVCLVDFEKPQFPNFLEKVEAIVKGDQKSLNIASASIIAKVVRDKIMIDYDTQYPNYGFKNHKGYYTKNHQIALQNYGICDIHRISCAPVKKYSGII
ncbi:ribonuclease HII [Spiroplasma endosymbiont of Tiphia femorata]|uniref:ribonuclease HII n=2 Tax=unclassified Spiroplasma TaxID=2637901 RepID=UPI0030CD34F0